jgi:hypothetical protein
VPNAENRRVRVVKETAYTEPAKFVPIAIETDGDAQIVEYDEYGQDWK